MKKSLLLLLSITGLFIADCDYSTDNYDEYMDKNVFVNMTASPSPARIGPTG